MDGVTDRLPQELTQFFDRPGPQSMLIRGVPGSGKSTLALALLAEFGGQRFYITGRVRNSELQRGFPWLGANRSRTGWHILDRTETPTTAAEAARLGTALAHIQRDSNEEAARQRRWLPGAIQEAWSRLDRSAPAMIAIDPWNALVEQYIGQPGSLPAGLPSREDLERFLLSLTGSENVHLILVMEARNETPLDYLVDGVVVTATEARDGGADRWVSFPKLRGIRIETPEYPFTLEEARFTAFPRLQVRELRPRPPEKVGGQARNTVWPGSSDFFRAFGPMDMDTLTLIELEPSVPREIHRILFFPLIVSQLKRGGAVLLMPPSTLNHEDSFIGIKRLVSQKILEHRLRILGVFPDDLFAREFHNVSVPPHRISWKRDGIGFPLPDDSEFLRPKGSHTGPNLVLAYLSGLEGLAQAVGATMTREAIPGIARRVFGRGNAHMVGVGRSDDPALRLFSTIAAKHIQIIHRRGRVLIGGERPYTPEYVLEQDPDSPKPYSLIRLV